MLGRQMFGYAPALVVTALASFASVSLFTSWMSQSEYGQYALAINAMTMIIGVCFFWLQSAASRLMPQEIKEGKENKFFATLYISFAASSLVLACIAIALLIFVHSADWQIALWFAVPLAILRALLNLNQSIHRNFVHIGRYSTIEIGQAVIGLAAAAFFVVFLHFAASGAALGLALGLLAMVLFDWRLLGKAYRHSFDRRVFREIAHFGTPFIVTYGLSFILSGSDRFLIEYFLGPDQVGIYSAGYALPDRIGQNLFMAVATASFPLLIRRMEREGIEAARAQTYTNGVALLGLVVPACVGMLLLNRQIAAVLIGADFRTGAIMIMPWITVATILNGIAAHYFDHAFHLVKKTRLFFYTLGPAALLNFVGNIYAIPHFGIIGAAWTTLAAYALYLTLSIIIGRRVFRVEFPFQPALQIVLSAAVMGIVLSMFDFPENAVGLIEMVALGGAVYGVGVFTFDILGARNFVMVRLGRGLHSKDAGDANLKFEILDTAAQIANIADEWRTLYNSRADLFGSYEWFQIWESDLGPLDGTQLHVVIARSISGQMVGILPLVIRRAGFIRILEWAGQEVFDYNDILTEDPRTAEAMWKFVCTSSSYDVALIKDVHFQALSLSILSNFMQQREQRKNYFLTLDFASGEAWLSTQSRKLRGDTRRKTEKMEVRGAVAFHCYKKGDGVPKVVVDTLYAQKAAWFGERYTRGAFAQKGIRNFLQRLAEDAARRGELYLAWLSCGDTVIACHMGFIRGGVLYLYHTTYQAEYAEFSPGSILMVETIKAAIDGGLRELDFMRGDESYKERFATGHRLLSDFVLGRTGFGRAATKLKTLFTRP